jgi:hypothetical protein
VLFAHCVCSTVLTASLVDEREDDSDDDHHEHEEPQTRVHTGILRLATGGRLALSEFRLRRSAQSGRRHLEVSGAFCASRPEIELL